MHLAVLKTIAGFLNAKEAPSLIGVADSGEVVGLDADNFPNEDKMGLHLVNLVKDRMGEVFLPYVHYRFEDQDTRRTLLVRCEKGRNQHSSRTRAPSASSSAVELQAKNCRGHR